MALQRPALVALALATGLAGCGITPGTLPTVGGGGWSQLPGMKVPTAPTVAAKDPMLAAGVAGFKIYVNTVTHPANSFVIATNRNHTADNFPNGAAKLAKLKELKPSWGQGRTMYRIGHGPTDGRSDYDYMTGYHFEANWDRKGGYPYDDLRHALDDAKALEAEQLHVINFGTGSPEEAARYVSYLNHPDDANRKAHPYPVQHARFFELGNEISWSMVRGHAQYAATETQYAQRAKAFAQAMRKASPEAIQIGAVASTNSNFRWEGGGAEGEVVKNILTTMGKDVDFLIYHGYPSWPLKQAGNPQTLMAQNAWTERLLTTQIEPAIKQHAAHPVRLANTEFFTEQYDNASQARGLFGALYSADTITLALNHDMLVANQFCMDHGDTADAAFFMGDDPARTTAIFRFQRMLARHWGDAQLRFEPQGVPTTRVGDLDMPNLGFTASKGRDGKIYMLVTNRTPSTQVSVQLATGLTPRKAIAYQLSGPSGWDTGPEAATERELAVDVSQPVSFPAASITLLELTP